MEVNTQVTDATDTSTQENENQEIEENSTDTSTQENEDDNSTDSKDENEDDNSTNKKDDTKTIEEDNKTFETVEASSDGEYNIQSNMESLAAVKVKVDQAKNSSKSNSKNFYSDLDNILTTQQKELKFNDDQTEYFQAIEEAKKEWDKKQSLPTQDLEQELQDAEFNLTVAKAIESTLKKYPDYNHKKLKTFYTEELNKKEQRELDKGSDTKNLASYFEKIHKLYKSKYPSKVADTKAPDVPNMKNKTTKTIDAQTQTIQEKEDKDYLANIGFRKL